MERIAPLYTKTSNWRAHSSEEGMWRVLCQLYVSPAGELEFPVQKNPTCSSRLLVSLSVCLCLSACQICVTLLFFRHFQTFFHLLITLTLK